MSRPDSALLDFISEGDSPSPPRQAIQKVNYSHDGMIDLIIARRGISQNELAATFGYSASWISQVMQSDAFQDRLRARTAELVDPSIIATVDEQLKGIVSRSMEILKEKLSAPPDQIPDSLALRSLELSSRALGLGVKAPVTNVHVSMEAHLEQHAGRLEALLVRKKSEADLVPQPPEKP